MIFNLNSTYYRTDPNLKYLYKNGKICEEFEAGFTGIGELTNEEKILTFTSKYNSSYGNYNSVLYSNTKIDFSEYSWLCVELETTNNNCYIGFDSDSSMSGTAVSSCMKITSSDINSYKIFKMPLNSLSTKKQAFSLAGEWTTFKIKRIWLSKNSTEEGYQKTVTALSFASG